MRKLFVISTIIFAMTLCSCGVNNGQKYEEAENYEDGIYKVTSDGYMERLLQYSGENSGMDWSNLEYYGEGSDDSGWHISSDSHINLVISKEIIEINASAGEYLITVGEDDLQELIRSYRGEEYIRIDQKIIGYTNGELLQLIQNWDDVDAINGISADTLKDYYESGEIDAYENEFTKIGLIGITYERHNGMFGNSIENFVYSEDLGKSVEVKLRDGTINIFELNEGLYKYYTDDETMLSEEGKGDVVVGKLANRDKRYSVEFSEFEKGMYVIEQTPYVFVIK